MKMSKRTEPGMFAPCIESLIALLEEKDTSKAYKALQELEKISDETGLIYCYTDKFIDMISSDKYVIRVHLLASYGGIFSGITYRFFIVNQKAGVK